MKNIGNSDYSLLMEAAALIVRTPLPPAASTKQINFRRRLALLIRRHHRLKLIHNQL